MPRIRRKATRKPETALERLSRLARERLLIQDTNAPLVNEFAAAQGDYGNGLTLAPDVKGAQRLTVTVNRGGTAVDRWERDELLSETQMAAIRYCRALWHNAQTERGVVANLHRIGGISHYDDWAQIEALNELAWLRKSTPDRYWDVFENVCRFDMSAGIAGSNLTVNRDAQTTAARLIVCFVADLVAMWRRL